MKNIFKKLIIATTGLLLLSGCYEQYALYEASKLPMDGKFVQVNNHKIYVVQKGEGKIPVIFESGWEVGGHLSWEKVQNEIAKKTYTLSYDRAGILRSESNDKPRTCTNISEELHQLLVEARVSKPYVLVAHSLGGIFMRCYAKRYKNEIAGIILVDSAHPKQINFYKKEIQESMKNLPPLWLVKLEAYSGIARVYSHFYFKGYPQLSSNDMRNIKMKAFISKSFITYMREGKHFQDMMDEVKGTTFNDIPLIVLSAKKSEKSQGIVLKDWKKLQNNIVKLSTDSKHIWIDSGHYIQLEKPNVVIDAIREMLKRINEK